MILVAKLDLHIGKMSVYTEIKFLASAVQKPDRQTERQTDSSEVITYRIRGW